MMIMMTKTHYKIITVYLLYEKNVRKVTKVHTLPQNESYEKLIFYTINSSGRSE